MSFKKSRGGGGGGGGEVQSRSFVSQKWTLLLCLACFCAGTLFTHRLWDAPDSQSISRLAPFDGEKLNLVSEGCEPKSLSDKNVKREVTRRSLSNHQTIESLDRKISDLERELASAKATQDSMEQSNDAAETTNYDESSGKRRRRRKYLMVVGINTAFSSRKRRDSVRDTWMLRGEDLKKVEEEKGIVMRFVIGHSSIAGGVLDKAIDAENKRHGDIMRLGHVEGYLELSAKTKTYFATAVKTWDADFYVKVDDDVHVNIATLGETLVRHRKKARVYVGCMKSGPVLAQKGVRYFEPEHWKFGESGNKYFRHATGQLYAISHDLAAYICANQYILHKYTNEDVSLGSWLIGLDVQHIDDRRICCGTHPDCEWKAQAGNMCIASFDWTCSGVCRSVDRMKEVHRRCGEGQNALWKASF